MKRFAVGAMVVALICSIIANVLLYMRYAGSRPLMTMAGLVVTRQDYKEALERQHGKPVLRKLVMARLVEREARSKGVLPTNAEVDARLTDMERNAPTLMARA
ncbi:MAG: hypothetical protein H8F28_27540, partial [Fibrella sp.]|nr:hypothetical protein [Armatimonadota bacterium]